MGWNTTKNYLVLLTNTECYLPFLLCVIKCVHITAVFNPRNSQLLLPSVFYKSLLSLCSFRPHGIVMHPPTLKVLLCIPQCSILSMIQTDRKVSWPLKSVLDVGSGVGIQSVCCLNASTVRASTLWKHRIPSLASYRWSHDAHTFPGLVLNFSGCLCLVHALFMTLPCGPPSPNHCDRVTSEALKLFHSPILNN